MDIKSGIEMDEKQISGEGLITNDSTEKIWKKDATSLEEQVVRLKNELYLEKELVKKLKRTQEDWGHLIAKVQPTIKTLSAQIKELQINLHLKNQELTNVLQSLSSGLIVTDLKGNILTFNRAAVAITGIEKEEALGQPINSQFQYSILPETLDENAFKSISQDYHQQFVYSKPDGEEIIIESSTTMMESDESERQGVIINLNDITQLRKLEEEAERKNRLTAMGEIAMQVAHEIRNPLGSIELFVSMMKMDFPEDSNEMELVQHITSAVRSMNHIISNLLEYAKPRPIALDSLDIHYLLTDFVNFVRFSAEQHAIEIQMDLTAKNHEIRGNGELVKQVFHNLFVNACQAMPEGGVLTISTKNREETDPVLLERFHNSFILERRTLPVINVSFEDTGKGMSEEIKKKVCDPFFTTREQGTGLGLSIVQNTMVSHKGTVLVDSALNTGTRVSLLFPQSGKQSFQD
ncbi:MAG: PAS domain S-box protein [Proteobacteria bacterium]|nr:PAS domain S-box protein [Pseudomonadota bacterium]